MGFEPCRLRGEGMVGVEIILGWTVLVCLPCLLLLGLQLLGLAVVLQGYSVIECNDLWPKVFLT